MEDISLAVLLFKLNSKKKKSSLHTISARIFIVDKD